MKQYCYFSRITADHWTSKNRLEDAAHKLAQKMDRKILTDSEVPSFKKEFQQAIDELNQEYKRCKPLRFSISNCLSKSGDIIIYCDGVFHMSLFLAK
jgi:hypothetical protein